MRGKGRLFDEEIVVADFEGIVEPLFTDFFRSFIGGGEGDHQTVGAPRELLDACRRLSDLNRIAAGHRHHENLRLGVGAGGEKCQTVAGRCPARRADASPIVSEGTAVAARNVHQDKVGVIAIVGVVRVGNYDHDRFSVGRNLRIRDPSDFIQVRNIEAASAESRQA